MINTNNPALRSWVETPEGSDFPIQNLPFGIFSTPKRKPRVGVAIGEHILDLVAVYEKGFFKELDFDKSVFNRPTLNDFIALGRPAWRAVRQRLAFLLLNADDNELQHHADAVLVEQIDAEMHMPVFVPDYTDFYSSIDHATNVGKMFRDPENALLPNWKHLPVGYHGRASSIAVTGTDVIRPKGQTMPPNADAPVFGPSKRMDFELEMAFVVGANTAPGQAVSTAQADDHIFGLLLFNDWSARDLQKWEYVPLGPFLAKSFASTVSPWIVTLEALEPFRLEGPKQDPAPLPYLQYEGKAHFDIGLEVAIQPEGAPETLVCRSNYKHLYWNMRQQLAHQTVNGCNLRVGDLYASGTISGPEPSSFGSMLELSWGGKNPVELTGGQTRTFLQDGDTVVMRAAAQNADLRIGFGECRAKILPAQ